MYDDGRPLLNRHERDALRRQASYRLSVAATRVTAVSLAAYVLFAEYIVHAHASDTVVDVGSAVLLPVAFGSSITSMVNSIVLTVAKRRVLGGRSPGTIERSEMRAIWLRDVLGRRQKGQADPD